MGCNYHKCNVYYKRHKTLVYTEVLVYCDFCERVYRVPVSGRY